MKKGLRKLILSGTALAAVAATLGTSTYAWYTANETVSATDINGASAGAADASIFISKDHLAWSSTVAMTDTDILGGDLLPVEYISGATDTFKDLGTKASSTYTAGNARTVDNGAAKKFTLYFRTSKIADDGAAPTVYLKGITLSNTTPTSGAGAYTPADNLFYTTDEDHGVDTDQATYGVDFTQALKMVIRTDATTNGITDTTDTSYVAQNVNTKSWDLVNYESDDLNDNLTTVDASHNALTYYNAIMGTTLAATDNARQNQSVIEAKNTSSTSRTPISLGTLKRDASYITVDFYIYLDGWDTYCYDACKGQSFQLDLEFTSKADEALTYTAA